MALPLVSGCGVQNKPGAQAPAPGAADEASKVVQVALRVNYLGTEYHPDAIAYIEDHANVKLDIIQMHMDGMQDKLNLMLAGGDRPEIVQYYDDAYEKRLADSGMVLPLKEVMETKAPNLKKEWGEKVWAAMTHEDGEIYAIPTTGDTFADFTQLYRKDWLDKIGMSIPKTLDEYYDVAVAVSQLGSNVTGQEKVYAFGGFEGFRAERYFDHIFGAYGAPVNFWLNIDGELINGSVRSGAKEALKFVNRLYEAGAIDPEFVTDDEMRPINKMVAGMYGAPNDYMVLIQEGSHWWDIFYENCPEADIVYEPGNLTVNFPDKPTGQRANNPRGWLKTSVLKEAKNVDAAIRLIDWLATTEGNMFYMYGIPDVDYTLKPNGVVVPLTLGDDATERSLRAFPIASKWLILDSTPEYRKMRAEVDVNCIFPAEAGLFVSELDKYNNDLADYCREQFVKMAVGDIPIETGFDAFVTGWNERGGKALTEALNAAAAKKK